VVYGVNNPFVSRTLVAKGLTYMPRGLKMSIPQIANMILFINISDFFKVKNIYIMTFRVADWDIFDHSLAF
jgi:hypothetical protein